MSIRNLGLIKDTSGFDNKDIEPKTVKTIEVNTKRLNVENEAVINDLSNNSLITSQLFLNGRFKTTTRSTLDINGLIELNNSVYVLTIEQFISELADAKLTGGKSIIMAPGTFIVNEQIEVPSNTDIKGSGINTTRFKSRSGFNSQSVFKLGSNTSIMDFSINGNNEDVDLLVINGVSNVVINLVKFNNSNGNHMIIENSNNIDITEIFFRIKTETGNNGFIRMGYGAKNINFNGVNMNNFTGRIITLEDNTILSNSAESIRDITFNNFVINDFYTTSTELIYLETTSSNIEINGITFNSFNLSNSSNTIENKVIYINGKDPGSENTDSDLTNEVYLINNIVINSFILSNLDLDNEDIIYLTYTRNINILNMIQKEDSSNAYKSDYYFIKLLYVKDIVIDSSIFKYNESLITVVTGNYFLYLQNIENINIINTKFFNYIVTIQLYKDHNEEIKINNCEFNGSDTFSTMISITNISSNTEVYCIVKKLIINNCKFLFNGSDDPTGVCIYINVGIDDYNSLSLEVQDTFPENNFYLEDLIISNNYIKDNGGSSSRINFISLDGKLFNTSIFNNYVEQSSSFIEYEGFSSTRLIKNINVFNNFIIADYYFLYLNGLTNNSSINNGYTFAIYNIAIYNNYTYTKKDSITFNSCYIKNSYINNNYFDNYSNIYIDGSRFSNINIKNNYFNKILADNIVNEIIKIEDTEYGNLVINNNFFKNATDTTISDVDTGEQLDYIINLEIESFLDSGNNYLLSMVNIDISNNHILSTYLELYTLTNNSTINYLLNITTPVSSNVEIYPPFINIENNTINSDIISTDLINNVSDVSDNIIKTKDNKIFKMIFNGTSHNIKYENIVYCDTFFTGTITLTLQDLNTISANNKCFVFYKRKSSSYIINIDYDSNTIAKIENGGESLTFVWDGKRWGYDDYYTAVAVTENNVPDQGEITWYIKRQGSMVTIQYYFDAINSPGDNFSNFTVPFNFRPKTNCFFRNGSNVNANSAFAYIYVRTNGDFRIVKTTESFAAIDFSSNEKIYGSVSYLAN